MYEFDEQRWNQQQDEQDATPWRQVQQGWLIQRVTTAPSARIRTSEPQFLQIGTGQWCAARYATLFPLRSAAIVYARAYGYRVGESVEIVNCPP